MSEKFTPGPWVLEASANGEYDISCRTKDGLYGGWFMTLDHGIPRNEAQEDSLAEFEANARLISAAPAMELALQLLSFGLARIERSGPLCEFCFAGIRYSTNGDWNALMSLIGWDSARAALAKAGATHD